MERHPIINPVFALQRDQIISQINKNMGIPSIIPGEYRNPFDFIDEFEQWWEFNYRKIFDKEKTSSIIEEMLEGDYERINSAYDADYSVMKAYANRYYGGLITDNRSMVLMGVMS